MPHPVVLVLVLVIDLVIVIVIVLVIAPMIPFISLLSRRPIFRF